MNFPFNKNGRMGNNNLHLGDRVKQATFLVVDDFDAMRKVTINQLKQLGVSKIFEAGNGAEALKVLAKQPITMILSDWNMPVMSGLDFLLSIRSDEKYRAIPFLMITAEAERERIMTAIHAGVSGLLVKPYTSALFGERVEKCLDWVPRNIRPLGKGPGSPAVPPSASSIGHGQIEKREKPTILVVDDVPDNLHLLSQIFKDQYRVKVAQDGEKALAICHSDTPPDLVLLDVMMPGMDGFEVAQHLREHPSSEHIPVIFVTAMVGDEARLKGMELGAVDFVTKPIAPDSLKLRVKNFMRYIELHRQLQADYDQMLDAERLKDDVEQIMRHDMKGPLSGIIGLAQGLADAANLTEAQREELRVVEETAFQMLDMINLSNELYKIETDRFVLRPQAIAIPKITRRVTELVRKAFSVKDLTIEVVTPLGVADEELVAIGDPMLCYSLFQNLLKNACEAAPEGTTVTVAIHAGSQMHISVENHGVVPMAIRETFFEKFATAGKQGGTGLGTYSAKLLTEAQNGTIAMETSDQTNLTRVSVTLPTQ